MPAQKPICRCGKCKKCRNREAAKRWRARNQDLVRAYREANRDEIRDYHRRWAAANPEKGREATQRWRERNLGAIRAKAAAYREANREEIREYNRAWIAANPEKAARWAKENPEKHNAKTRRWRERNPEKYAAQTKAGNAIKSGRLVRQPCEVCGAEPAQAHHPDYSKPLDVQWLCLKHHREIQRKK